MTDARAVLASLRPQAFGKGRPERVSDPIVEPQWAGIRALAAVDRAVDRADDRATDDQAAAHDQAGADDHAAHDQAGALLVDESGEPIRDQPDIVSALAAAALSNGIVLDGFLTKQAAQDGRGVYIRTDVVPTLESSVGHFFLGSRRNPAAEAAQAREELRLAETFEPDDIVTYVAIDLLWLDGQSLLDIPLLERRRLLDTVLAESEIVRRGTFVRPPIGGWIRSWRAQGFVGVTFRAANSRYESGAVSSEWATASMPR